MPDCNESTPLIKQENDDECSLEINNNDEYSSENGLLIHVGWSAENRLTYAHVKIAFVVSTEHATIPVLPFSENLEVKSFIAKPIEAEAKPEFSVSRAATAPYRSRIPKRSLPAAGHSRQPSDAFLNHTSYVKREERGPEVANTSNSTMQAPSKIPKRTSTIAPRKQSFHASTSDTPINQTVCALDTSTKQPACTLVAIGKEHYVLVSSSPHQDTRFKVRLELEVPFNSSNAIDIWQLISLIATRQFGGKQGIIEVAKDTRIEQTVGIGNEVVTRLNLIPPEIEVCGGWFELQGRLNQHLTVSKLSQQRIEKSVVADILTETTVSLDISSGIPLLRFDLEIKPIISVQAMRWARMSLELHIDGMCPHRDTLVPLNNGIDEISYLEEYASGTRIATFRRFSGTQNRAHSIRFQVFRSLANLTDMLQFHTIHPRPTGGRVISETITIVPTRALDLQLELIARPQVWMSMFSPDGLERIYWCQPAFFQTPYRSTSVRIRNTNASVCSPIMPPVCPEIAKLFTLKKTPAPDLDTEKYREVFAFWEERMSKSPRRGKSYRSLSMQRVTEKKAKELPGLGKHKSSPKYERKVPSRKRKRSQGSNSPRSTPPRLTLSTSSPTRSSPPRSSPPISSLLVPRSSPPRSSPPESTPSRSSPAWSDPLGTSTPGSTPSPAVHAISFKKRALGVHDDAAVPHEVQHSHDTSVCSWQQVLYNDNVWVDTPASEDVLKTDEGVGDERLNLPSETVDRLNAEREEEGQSIKWAGVLWGVAIATILFFSMLSMHVWPAVAADISNSSTWAPMPSNQTVDELVGNPSEKLGIRLGLKNGTLIKYS